MKPRKTVFLFLLVWAALFVCNSMAYEGPTYTNPVLPNIGPADPTIILHDGVYYMYPTGDNVSFDVYTSYDLVNWEYAAKVFQPGGHNLWAPDVFYNQDDGKFYMYYTWDFRIGVAVADSPTGPFHDHGILRHGVIDAHVFRDDDGSLYLYYTDLGHIYVHRMSSPIHLTGGEHRILSVSQEWEHRTGWVNEGPWMMKHNGVYYLLYSGSAADSADYAIGYATADNPMGPFTKYHGNPIIHRSDGVYGPGHGAVTVDATGNLWHIYHQKIGPELSYERFVCIDPMWFDRHGVLHSRATRGVDLPAPAKRQHPRTSAYWRFENGNAGDRVRNPKPGGVFYLSIPDSSGNGNYLSVWDEDRGGYIFRSEVASPTIPQTNAPNNYSVKNSGSTPSMWTNGNAWISGIKPSAFTIEATFKLENGDWRTIVGRDSRGTNTAGNDPDQRLAALYLQALPNNALAIKFCDVAGYWHEAVSAENVFESFDFETNPDGDGVPWYSVVAVSDGSILSLYLLNHSDLESGYQLIAQTDMAEVNPSPNTALTAGAGGGHDWTAGSWSIGRGMFDGHHGDRAWGYLDEIRISHVALSESEFLFSDPQISGAVAYWRFEDGSAGDRVPHSGQAGEFYPGIIDVSGNGNHLSAWSETTGSYSFSDDVPFAMVPRTKAANQLSVRNRDQVPGMFTSSADAKPAGVDIETWQPLTFTIEASFKPRRGDGHRTIVGRNGMSVTSHNGALSALYLQVQADESIAVKFADVAGYWHQAVSEPGLIKYEGSRGDWHHIAAVCDGDWLRLYLFDINSDNSYRLVAETDISASGSSDRRLVADTTFGSDWHGGGWTVGRGLYAGNHDDRFVGHIDEVRISACALRPDEFLFQFLYDFNGDSFVDAEDLAVLADYWLLPRQELYDYQDFDGVINFEDFASFANYWYWPQ